MKSIHCGCMDAVESVDLIWSHARTHAPTQFFSESESWL